MARKLPKRLLVFPIVVTVILPTTTGPLLSTGAKGITYSE